MKRRGLILDSYDTAAKGYTMTKLELQTPQIVESFTKVDGMHGSLDFCETATGAPVYKPRPLTATFELSNGSQQEREHELSAFVHTVHGKRCKIIHPDYPDRYLMGRVQLSREFNNLAYGQIALTAVCDPWLYEMHDTFLELQILDRSHNLITYDNVVALDDLSSCRGNVIGDTEIVTVTLVTAPADPHTYAVFRVSLSANTTYYFSGRMISKGYWRVSAEATLPEKFSPIVTTGDDGYAYIYIVRLQSYSYVNLNDMICLEIGDVSVLKNGIDSAPLSSSKPEDVSVILSINGRSFLHGGSNAPKVSAPGGDALIAAFRHDTTDAVAAETVRWQRRWI